MVWIALEERIDDAEWNSGVDGEFLDGQALLVQEILVGRIDQLDGCLVVKLL